MHICCIAKNIGSALRLNLDLIEAIALAHDIGHTPFGHQGERTLHERQKALKVDRIGSLNYGGFKHNYQSVRVLSQLESWSPDFPGLNLSTALLDGVLKHTKLKPEYNLDAFFDSELSNYLYPEYSEPTTLEGQVVKISDEIAQRGHDIEDSLSSNHLSYEQLLAFVSQSSKTSTIKDIIAKCKNDISPNTFHHDKESLLKKMILRAIVNHFTMDVVAQSYHNMRDFDVKSQLFVDRHRFDKSIICASKEGAICLNYLEDIINKRVITSAEISQFDGKSDITISNLFDTLYNTPTKLPDTVLESIYLDMRLNGLETTRYRNSNTDLLKTEIRKIHSADDEESKTKNVILVRHITDYIAGMTDSYAIEQYHRFFI